jgi:hypothetical protein
MVPLSEKRHRLYTSEIYEVILGLRLQLLQLLEEKKEPEKAEIAFHYLYRLRDNNMGRPKYPEFNWDTVSFVLEIDEKDLLNRDLK